MAGTIGLKDLAQRLSSCFEQHGDIPVIFHDKNEQIHELIGDSVANIDQSGVPNKVFVIRGYKDEPNGG